MARLPRSDRRKAIPDLTPFRFAAAGQRSAILYSLIVSCQRHGKDPLVYLRDVLTRLPRMTNRDDLTPLLPSNWTPPVPGTLVAAS